MKSKAVCLVAMLLGGRLLTGQIDHAFILHLNNHDLKTEHRAYLNSIPYKSDSLYYYETNYYLKYFNDSLFVKNYQVGKAVCRGDSILIKKANTLMMQSHSSALQKLWYDSLSPIKYNGYGVYKAILNPKNYPDTFFCDQLRNSFLAYKKMSRKSPFLAATMSALLPGSGKLYAGKWRSGLMALGLNMVYAFQFAESYKKLEIKHPLNFINAGAFVLFYASNVYGSYKAVVELRKERKKQFITDAINYYN